MPAPRRMKCCAPHSLPARRSLCAYMRRVIAVHVDVLLHVEDKEHRSMTRRLRLTGDLDEAQRARLADIAERTPVTLTLKQGVAITTVLE